MGKTGLGEMPESANAKHLERQWAPPTGKEDGSFSGTDTVQGVGGIGKSPGERPEFKVVQAEYDTRIGKTIFKDVGAMWKNTSRGGHEFYTMKIGKLKLLVFPNRRD